ncbi:hypothetical protein Tco_0561093 [Tanacetum coccineum]
MMVWRRLGYGGEGGVVMKQSWRWLWWWPEAAPEKMEDREVVFDVGLGCGVGSSSSSSLSKLTGFLELFSWSFGLVGGLRILPLDRLNSLFTCSFDLVVVDNGLDGATFWFRLSVIGRDPEGYRQDCLSVNLSNLASRFWIDA